MKTNAKKQVEIIPDVSLMKKMASTQGTIPSRLMELVDNSIDAKIPGKPLEVKVNIVRKGTKHYMEVIDNGHGMDELTARSFFRLADSKKEGKNKIGRFGLGSKIAIMGIGDSCTVSTSRIDVPQRINIDFDINQFTEWKIDYKVKEEKAETHGTKIKINDITVRIGDIDRFCDRLRDQFSKTYQHYLEQGDVQILINGKAVLPKSVELLPGYYQTFDFEISNGKRVYGWAGASKESAPGLKFGFSLINNGRIIKQYDLLTRQRHTSLSRLVGEIHLDSFSTDIHKSEFHRENDEWEEMQTQLLDVELADLMTRISKLTNREVLEKYGSDLHRVSTSLNRVVRSYDFLQQIDVDEGIFKKLKRRARRRVLEKQEQQTPEDVLTFEQLDEILDLYEEKQNQQEKPKKKANNPERKSNPNVGLVIEEPVPVSLGEDSPAKRWSFYEKDGGTYVTIEINLDHPTYQDEEEVGTMVKTFVLECVAEFILNEERKHTGFLNDEIERFNELKDMLMRYSVSLVN